MSSLWASAGSLSRCSASPMFRSSLSKTNRQQAVVYRPEKHVTDAQLCLWCTSMLRWMQHYVSFGGLDCSSSFRRRGCSSNASHHACQHLTSNRLGAAQGALASVQLLGGKVRLDMPCCDRHAGIDSKCCVNTVVLCHNGTMATQTEVLQQFSTATTA